MEPKILSYLDSDDRLLSDFTRRLSVLAREDLISARHLHHAIDLLSLQHIVHSRVNCNDAGVPALLQLQLSSIFDDLEVLEHFQDARLVIQGEHSVAAKNLLNLQMELRTLGNELVEKLKSDVIIGDVKRLQKRLEIVQKERAKQIKAFADAISNKVAFISIGHGGNQIVGLPTVLFGWWNTNQREVYVAWRDSLPPKKRDKLQKSVKREKTRRSRDETILLYLEPDFAPVFRVKMRPVDDLENYVPYHAISRLYFSLYKNWNKKHLKYESQLFVGGSGLKRTLFRQKLPRHPSLTPRQLMHELVANICGKERQ